MKNWLVDHKYYALAAVFLIFGSLYYFFIYQTGAPSNPQMTNVEKSAAADQAAPKAAAPQAQPEKPQTVMVDVKGEVKKPGVYVANQSERVVDVIQRAGGLTEKADEKQVNLAAHVQDAAVLYIPAKGENPASIPAASASGSGGVSAAPATGEGNSSSQAQTAININSADETELQNLPGIGPAKATAIIQYRNENGPFQKPEDLKNVTGIGDKTFEKLKDAITVQ